MLAYSMPILSTCAGNLNTVNKCYINSNICVDYSPFTVLLICSIFFISTSIFSANYNKSEILCFNTLYELVLLFTMTILCRSMCYTNLDMCITISMLHELYTLECIMLSFCIIFTSIIICIYMSYVIIV